MSILDVLVEKGAIGAYDVDSIMAKAAELGDDIYEALLKGGIPQDQVLQATSEYYAVPIASVAVEDIRPDVFKHIPAEAAAHYRVLPIEMNKEGVLEVAMVDPGSVAARNVLEFMFGESKTPFFISAIALSDFQKVIRDYSTMADTVVDTGEDDTGTDDHIESLEELLQRRPEQVDEDTGEIEKIVESAPITKMVASILMRAIDEGVSDVHIERTEFNTKVRYRVDGQMAIALTLPKRVHNAVVARVKILAKLKLDERRKPQDGRFPARVHDRNIDFRVSTMPTYFGEKVVMRILDPDVNVHSLESTGMTREHMQIVRKAIQEPHGIILITGPTGSGKSTTVYSILQEMDRESRNVVSLEDPVEFSIEGVNQSQVQPEIGYTFANGLRSILRQDPDIIFVGEIRDKETAQLAIRAALTGHLVLSTLHTNNSIGVIPRLVDMGVDPYLIAPTLRLAMAQRLTRRIADGAGSVMEMQESLHRMVENEFKDLPDEFRTKYDLHRPLFEANATEKEPTGMKGRVAVHEMYLVDDDIEKIILAGADEQSVYASARKKGMITMKEDALLKCMDGLIPFSETTAL